MRPRRRSVLLRTQRRARVRAILTRTQQTAVRLELLAVFVRLAVHVTRLRCFRLADAAMTVVEHQVAMQSSVFIALVAPIAQVSLLARTNVTTVAAVFDGVRRLAARRVVGTFARVDTQAAPR